MSVVFDKLSFVKRLEGDGSFTRPQAEALSDAFHQAVSETVATKADVGEVRVEVAALRVDLTHEIAAVRTELKQDIAAVRVEIETVHVALKHHIESIAVGMKTELDNVRSDARHDTELLRAEMKAGFAELRSSIAESRIWAVSVGASVVAVLAAIKYFG